MSNWPPEDLDRIGTADELGIAALQADGSLRPYTTIWVVQVRDDLYVRSVRGRDSIWFSSAVQRHEGRIRAGGSENDVTFEEPSDADHDAIDQEFRRKYAQSPAEDVDPTVTETARAATLRLNPR
jgi:hypothetical protein